MATRTSVVPPAWRPFAFSVLVVSSWSVKALHLYRHLNSLSLLAWLLSLPLLLLQDVALATAGRFLLAYGARRWKLFDLGLLGVALAYENASHVPNVRLTRS